MTAHLNRIKAILETQMASTPLLVSLGFVVGVGGLFFLTAVPRFESNDDAAMMISVAGLHGTEPSEYIFITHVLIGKLLVYMYRLLGLEINWYSIYLYFYHFLSLFVLTYTIIKRWPYLFHFFFYTVLILIVEIRAMQLLQMTTTAAMAGVSGGFYLLSALKTQRTGDKLLVITAIFLFVSMGLIRREVLYLFSALFFPLVFFKSVEKRTIRPAVLFLLAIAIFSGLHWYERLTLTPEVRSFYNRVDTLSRIRINPRFFPKADIRVFTPTEAMQRAIEKNGWSKNDIDMYIAWIYFDPEVFSNAKFENILSEYRLLAPFNPFPRIGRWLHHYGFYTWYFLTTILLIFLLQRNRDRLYLLASTVTVLSIILCLGYSWRLPLRVYLSLGLYLGVAGIYYLSRNPPSGPARIVKPIHQFIPAVTILILITFSAISVSDFQRTNALNRSGYTMAENLFREITKIAREKKSLIVLTEMVPVEFLFKPHAVALLKDADLLLHGWFTRGPGNLSLLRKYAIGNIMKALYEQDNILLLANTTQRRRIQRFLREHYHQNISFLSINSLIHKVVVPMPDASK